MGLSPPGRPAGLFWDAARNVVASLPSAPPAPDAVGDTGPAVAAVPAAPVTISGGGAAAAGDTGAFAEARRPSYDALFDAYLLAHAPDVRDGSLVRRFPQGACPLPANIDGWREGLASEQLRLEARLAELEAGAAPPRRFVLSAQVRLGAYDRELGAFAMPVPEIGNQAQALLGGGGAYVVRAPIRCAFEFAFDISGGGAIRDLPLAPEAAAALQEREAPAVRLEAVVEIGAPKHPASRFASAGRARAVCPVASWRCGPAMRETDRCC